MGEGERQPAGIPPFRGRNIVVFSDGTGQRGGLFVDERRSNVYKLYRATRCAPDTNVDPKEQLAFYDPGLGTLPEGGAFFSGAWRKLYNLASQATGLGLTGNIIDCYAAILRLCQPGDRIFLFGFSRGAYTIRCLGGVLSLCGVPTRMKDGSPLLYDEGTSKKIAREAVKKVYQHTSSRPEKEATPRQRELLAQRRALARRFRERYGSGDADGPGVYPYFIGVFDTVASLANPLAIMGLSAGALLFICLPLGVLWYFFPWLTPWIVALAVILAGLTGLAYLATHIKVAFGLPGHRWWRTFHFTEPRMKFYDRSLNENVSYARHAIAIDENRASFERVKWGDPAFWKESTPPWFEQMWFAGDHSDIGGSYIENESRLSDIALRWMIDAAETVGLKHDQEWLKTFPDPLGPQHDETKSSIFRFAGKKARDPVTDSPLHPSVMERFAASAVRQYDRMLPYRPGCLRRHKKVAHFYEADRILHERGEGAAGHAEEMLAAARKANDKQATELWEGVAADVARRAR
jgi:uncharacterized protein (DUF2235 family)